MRYLSVCSGIEAVSVAWQPLGWQPAMFAEIDPFCCWLLRSRYGASRPQHMPSPHEASDRKDAKRRAAAIRNIVALPVDGAVINAGDFTKIGEDDVGTIDLLAGGTPCQSFSIAGKRAGLDDPRGNLTIEFARLADRLRPTWLVWENVPGVLSIDDGRTFGAFLRMLVECGYGVAYRVLDAEYFGVPQRRRRVFVVGCAGNWRAAAAVLLDFAGLSGHPPPRRKARQGVAGGVEVGPAGGRFTDTAPAIDAGCKDGFVRNQPGAGVLASTDEISHCLNTGGMGRQDYETETLLGVLQDSDFGVTEYPAAGAMRAGRIPEHQMVVHSLSADGFDASEDGTGRGVPMVPVAICTAPTQSNGSGFPDGIAHTLESGSAQAVAFNLRGREGGAMPEVSGSASLRASAGGSTNSYIAFSAKDHGADADDIAPTLRGMGHDGSHANGGGQVAVAFTLHGSDGTASTATPAEIAGSVRTKPPGSIENSSTTAVLQEQPVAWSGEITASTGITGALQRGGEGGRVDGVMTPQMAVRRLTPRECERLQGFPDDYTLVEYRGKLAADGPRYKALGNSMAVPVMRWIGQRIAAVHEIVSRRSS